MSKCQPLCAEGKLFDLTCATCPSVTAAATDDDIVTWTSHSTDAPGEHRSVLVCVPLRECSRGERELFVLFPIYETRTRAKRENEEREKSVYFGASICLFFLL